MKKLFIFLSTMVLLVSCTGQSNTSDTSDVTTEKSPISGNEPASGSPEEPIDTNF